MDWATYKKLCDRPDVMSRWMLIQSRQLLPATLADLLSERTCKLIAKPAGHRAQSLADMFQLKLSGPEARRIVQALTANLADGRQLPDLHKREHFLLVWQALLAFVESP